jgi:hypothetical protein
MQAGSLGRPCFFGGPLVGVLHHEVRQGGQQKRGRQKQRHYQSGRRPFNVVLSASHGTYVTTCNYNPVNWNVTIPS